MKIKFRRCTSEKHHLTREFTGLDTEVTGVLRDQASVMDPIVQIETTQAIAQYNYFEIEAFGRKYFITDTPVLVNGMWEIKGHVDVIGTWLDEIKAAPVMTKEREAAPDYYINDDSVIMDDRNIVQVLFFDGDTRDERHDDDLVEPGDYWVDNEGHCCFNPNGWQYILVTQGPGTTINP